MVRVFGLAIFIGLSSSMSAAAADAARFKFEKGQVLTYHVVQATTATETVIDEKTTKPIEQQHVTKHSVVRKWKVTDVDDKGVATLAMSIDSMKWEQKRPDGQSDTFDSAKPDDLQKNEEMAKMIGPVVAVVRIDTAGKVVEVKESKFGSPARFTIDLPLKIVLPESGPKEGQTWDRTFTIKLDPPQGTGETYEAIQKFTAKTPVNGFTVIAVSTTVKELPAQASDQIPLLPMLMEGDVYFHERSGRYYAARLKIKRELSNHQGEGTKYIFESTYAEDLKVEKK
jgi:hypothetical protein